MEQQSETICFCDDTGREWTVFEAGAVGDRYLFFHSSEVFRRVRHYPANWEGLSSEALCLLSWQL